MGAKRVRDPIHGSIALDDAFCELADTKHMQRLRNIRQNGLCYLVYPAMNSSRFEHSLGTYHLAGVVTKHLRLKEEDSMDLRAACLLHDIGHGPFSHTFDEMSRYGFDHEKQSAALIQKTEISDTLKKHSMNPKDVSDLVYGRGRLGKILSSAVDVDKMDYLVRDAYYAGVAYGVTDVERLLYSLLFEKGEVLVDECGLEATESLLINRNMMYQTVYRHHTKRIAESMIVNAIHELVEQGRDAKELAAMDDIGLVHELRTSKGYVKDMIERVEQRRLFKNVFSEPIALLTPKTRQELTENCRKVGKEIAKDLGIKQGYLLLDYPEARMSEYNVKVKTKTGLKSIDEVSALAKALEVSEQEKLTVNIYVRGEDRELMKDFRPEEYFTYSQKRITEWD